MKTGYARVSTKQQTVDLQADALKKAGCTKFYAEIMSGTPSTDHFRGRKDFLPVAPNAFGAPSSFA
jgi:DNA invertase Pin-like site-specific DNA recombinase